MNEERNPKAQRRPGDNGRLPQRLFNYLITHEYAAHLPDEIRRFRRDLERELKETNEAGVADRGTALELKNSLELARALENLRGAPWGEEAAGFAERIRRGAWDEINKGDFVDLLQDLSVAIRSRYDEPSAAAQKALRQIFDALSCPGPGRTYGWEGVKFDRLYRPGREALFDEWLVCVEAKKEAGRRRKADEEFDTVKFLKKRLGKNWKGRIFAIKRLVRKVSPGVKTKTGMRRALGLNTRDKPKRRSPKTAAINHLI